MNCAARARRLSLRPADRRGNSRGAGGARAAIVVGSPALAARYRAAGEALGVALSRRRPLRDARPDRAAETLGAL